MGLNQITELWQFAILFLLLSISIFFSASETALMSLNPLKIRNMVANKTKGADIVFKLVDNPNKLLGAILVGNNIANIGSSALATSLAIEYFGNNGVGIATGVMTVIVLIFGEITPKTLAAQNAEKMALKVGKLIHYITVILGPIIFVLMKVTNLLIRLLGGETDGRQPFITEDEIKTMINVGHEEGILEEEEKKYIQNVIEFGDLQVREVMIPRTDIAAADVNATYEEVLSIFKEKGFSRIPIYEDEIDNIIGILYLKDFIFYNGKIQAFQMEQSLRKTYFTYEFIRIAEVFAKMRKDRVQIAVVLDEYGGTAGIITLEDLVEEIVGEINDEYDQGAEEFLMIEENEYLVHGAVKIDMVNEILGTHIQSKDFDSIGGFVIGQFGRLPKETETIQYKEIEFVVEKVRRNRIELLKILI